MRFMRGLAVVCVALIVAAPASTDDKAKADKDKLQGKWKVVSAEREGKEIEAFKDANVTVVFEGDKIKVNFMGQEFEGTYKIDTEKKPKQFDSKVGEEERLGIYELDGDKLKICKGEPGEDRPTEFKTKEGAQITLIVYERVKN